MTLWTIACQAPLSMRLGINTGVGCHALPQGIFPIRRANLRLLHLLHWQVGSLPLESNEMCPFMAGLFLLMSTLSLRLMYAVHVTGTTLTSLRSHVSVPPLLHTLPTCSDHLLFPGPAQKGQPGLPASSPSFFQCISHTISKVILHFSF